MWIDDQILRRCSEDVTISCWVPNQTVVVLGSANDPDAELDQQQCQAEGVPVLRRYGGGGAVVLHGGCVVVSLGLWVRQHFQNRFYFERVNAAVIAALVKTWPIMERLGQRGLSDLVDGEYKIGGTSLFRSRNFLLYQASLLVESRLALIERFLRHPSREPDYRGGRTHRDFLRGLAEIEGAITPESCVLRLRQHLPETLGTCLAGELIHPCPEQFQGLLARAATTLQLTDVGLRL